MARGCLLKITNRQSSGMAKSAEQGLFICTIQSRINVCEWPRCIKDYKQRSQVVCQVSRARGFICTINLGAMYHEGEGVIKDYKTGVSSGLQSQQSKGIHLHN
ncbi:hypothetical protein BPLS_P6698 [Bathymodiolus platifrons methanotrophic gill symbiont]|nr:hypothetical protein BPLS_P6698 [Bathymodiolus platifrons methanotrophic gill symbiont]